LHGQQVYQVLPALKRQLFTESALGVGVFSTSSMATRQRDADNRWQTGLNARIPKVIHWQRSHAKDGASAYRLDWQIND
jgi:hypothetical protein